MLTVKKLLSWFNKITWKTYTFWPVAHVHAPHPPLPLTLAWRCVHNMLVYHDHLPGVCTVKTLVVLSPDPVTRKLPSLATARSSISPLCPNHSLSQFPERQSHSLTTPSRQPVYTRGASASHLSRTTPPGCLHCCRSLCDERSHTPNTPLKDAVASMGCSEENPTASIEGGESLSSSVWKPADNVLRTSKTAVLSSQRSSEFQDGRHRRD